MTSPYANLTIPGVNTTDPNFDPGDYCTLDLCPLDFANFTYVPTLAGNLTYLAIFGVLLIAQCILALRYKTWGFLVGMFGGLLLEILGYVGRVQLHYNPFPFDPFLMQLICLTIGPAFLSAAIYICLGRLIVAHSPAISRVKPKTYTIIFVCCDLLSLILQAAGGAITATADRDQPDLNQAGINIMIAGLASQVASLAVFMALCIEYGLRVRKNSDMLDPAFAGLRKSFMFRAFMFSIAIATITIFIRCVYRVAELNEGFNGHLANDEVLFMILEGPMIIIACIVLTVGHPGIAFAGRWAEAQPGKKNSVEDEYERAKVGSNSSIELTGP
ncbi:Sphingoid long-chain base transporter RSB1 [Lasiodiplodia hormozganensis]|uniref:Sphingoid long-chain base transporter RSB1 n=1 Tax=Lasiodiplodia hormozganensis TaxID=869390 RepID=A0AA39YJB8_9PEZI|nr:Sphingoid long-chain base transporter RSB1 [Lasiodiplodia hormozganensis]